MIDDLRPSPDRGLLHPVLLVTGLTLGVALLLLPLAVVRTGSGGLVGLLLAASICLVAGWVVEVLAWGLARQVNALGVMLLGMAVRMLPPLALCVYLAASGQKGRDHLAFIGYLLAFYFSTLALETFLSVKRVAKSAPSSTAIAK